jgi:putative DNA primase/helicase
VIRDRDDDGLAYAFDVERSLRGVAASVRMLECTKGKDVTDHLAAGGTLDGLVAMQGPPVNGRPKPGARARAEAQISGLSDEEIAEGEREVAEESPDWNSVPIEDAGPADTPHVRVDAGTFYKCSDTGNAERLVAHHGERIRYCAPWKSWLVWAHSGRWELDERGQVQQMAKLTARSIYREASRASDPKTRETIANLARGSEAKDRRVAMVVCAQSEPAIAVHFEDFDRDPYALNVQNGVINLRTGELRPHRREDLLTKIAPVEYRDDASAPHWEEFLRTVLPDPEVRAFVQRFAGYSATGDVSERAFVFLHGAGRNGKSVLLRVLRTMLGDYAIVAAPDLLIARRGEPAHPTELADLFGARLVVCQEVPKGRAFNEQRVKEITGNEGAIKARRMGENFWQFAPTFKLAIAGNHEPRVHDDTDAIWDRMRKVPFTVRIPDDKVDKHLFEKLRDEFPGILRWVVQGCLAWRKEGLGAPTAVAAATDAYRKSEDVVARFLEDMCKLEPSGRTTTKALTDAAAQWANANDERLARKTITDRLKLIRGVSERRTNKSRGWQGIRLLTEQEIADFDRAEPDSDGVTDGDTACRSQALVWGDRETTRQITSPSVTRHAPEPP